MGEEEVEKRGDTIGLAALKFYILSSPPGNSMLYDPEDSIRFEGNTGPSALYCYARTCSILKKCGASSVIETTGCLESLDSLQTIEEREILKCLASFNSDLMLAAENFDPAKVCNAVSKVSQAFSKFYCQKEKHAIKNCPDATLKEARLLLTAAVGRALYNGLC